MYEVEQKYPVADMKALEARLLGMGAAWHGSVEQVDRYFNHPSRDFAATDEALRLRSTGAGMAITWKGPRLAASAKTRREIELPLSLHDQPGIALIEQWTDLLEALGFRRVMEVAKRRRPILVAWQGIDVDVAIDAVAGLGDFVELERQAREGDVPHARGVLASLAEALGCTDHERRSYLELLLARPIEG